MRRLGAIAVALAALAPARAAPAADAGPPPDYRDTSALSQPVYTELVTERVRVPMRDGVRIYAEVTRPAADGEYGTIMELSPYHDNSQDRLGTATLPNAEGGVVGYFAPRGYAVVMADLRGTANSEGCLDYLGPVDRLDFYDLVEWAAAQDWSNERVGIVGLSYVGSTPIAAAAMRPPHLATVVPIAGIAQMYDHEFQWGVPYSLQWVGPLAAYEQLAAEPPTDQSDPGWARNTANAGCGAPNSAAATGPDYVTGRYTPWHAERDYRSQATGAPIPIFLVQGIGDRAVRPLAIDWFLRRGNRAGDKMWLGQWEHRSTDRGQQWTGALHRWFDRHLLARPVEVGPPVEVFLPGVLTTFYGPVRTETAWPGTTSTLTLYPAPGGSLATTPPPAAEVSYLAMPRLGTGLPDVLTFDTPVLGADVEIAGAPAVVVNEAIDGGRIDLIVSLYDVFPTGRIRLVTQAAMNPELRDGLGTVRSVTPGERLRLSPPAWPLDYLVRAGHRLRVLIASHETDKVPTFPGPGRIRLDLGGPDATRIELGVVDSPVLYPDPRLS